MVTIYALKDPRDGAIRYVGKTSRPPKVRLYFHLKKKQKTRNRTWLQSLRDAELQAEIAILEELIPQQDWRERERFWIAYYRSVGCDLNNHTDGGDGIDNPDDETRAKWSAAQRRLMADPAHRARVFTPEQAAKISAAIRGVPRPWVKTLPQNQPGRKMSEAFKSAQRQRMMGNSRSKGHSQRAWNKGLRFGRPSWNSGISPPAEVRAKISRKLTGRHISESHKEHIRVARVAYWEKIRREKIHDEIPT